VLVTYTARPVGDVVAIDDDTAGTVERRQTRGLIEILICAPVWPAQSNPGHTYVAVTDIEQCSFTRLRHPQFRLKKRIASIAEDRHALRHI